MSAIACTMREINNEVEIMNTQQAAIMSKKSHVQNIFIDDGGAGDVPVLFIHSLAGNTQQWAAQIDYLRKTRRAIAIDLRGHGQSQDANGHYTIDSLTEDVHAVVDALDLQKFVLVGHSLGGSVAVSYAGAYPERVAGLLLVDPSGDSTQIPDEELRPFLDAMGSEAYQSVIEGYWQQILTNSTKATVEKVMQALHNTPKATVVELLTSLFKYNPVLALNRYHGPKLSVITPITDTPIGLHKLVSDLPHVMVTGTGHWLHMDKPERFNQLLDDFLASTVKQLH